MQNVSKDYLFKLVVRMAGDDLHLDSIQRNRLLDTMVSVFEDI